METGIAYKYILKEEEAPYEKVERTRKDKRAVRGKKRES